MQAIICEHHEVADANSPIFSRNAVDQTLVMHAASRGHYQLVKMVPFATFVPSRALYTAACAALTSALRLQFLELGMDPNAISSKTGNNALHEAIPGRDSVGRKIAEDARHLKTASLLMDAGCNPWLRNHKGPECQSIPSVCYLCIHSW